MHEIWLQILAAWQAQSGLEIIAVLAAIMYLVLAIRENIWCWFFAFISTGIYIYLFHSVSLLSESLLNVYYLLMAVYGWYQWRRGNHHEGRKIISWSFRKHGLLIILTGLMVPLLGYTMNQLGASMPYLDAFTTCFAVLATVMVAHKVLENWHYWLVINVTSVYLFSSKELYLTAAMFVLYVVLTIIGYINWKNIYARRRSLV
jgi:nicotinamide mononucleotide transporter